MPAIEDDYLFTDKRNLAVGRKYKIILEDCCIKGEMDGTFIGFDNIEDRYIFDIGKIGPGWGAWRAVEITERGLNG